MAEVERWTERASLPTRHAQVCETVARSNPSIVTAVEFDQQWRSLPLPTNRPYTSARDLLPERGCGQATVLFDSTEFETVDVDGVHVPGIVRSQAEQGTGESPVRPKSSCLVLLRRRPDAAQKKHKIGVELSLVLVGAMHMESAPPSDSHKVALRRQQLRALLSEISLIAQDMLKQGLRCTVLLGGDFNAIREESVHGNTDKFYECQGTQHVRPALQRPKDGTALSEEAMGSPIARIDEGGGLMLACKGVDGGELIEATMNPAELPGAVGGRMGCTRAGNSMVIDFIFCGGIGGLGADTAPHVIATDEEAATAADESYGVLSAVQRWGSDHLPVGCDVTLP